MCQSQHGRTNSHNLTGFSRHVGNSARSRRRQRSVRQIVARPIQPTLRGPHLRPGLDALRLQRIEICPCNGSGPCQGTVAANIALHPRQSGPSLRQIGLRFLYGKLEWRVVQPCQHVTSGDGSTHVSSAFNDAPRHAECELTFNARD